MNPRTPLTLTSLPWKHVRTVILTVTEFQRTIRNCLLNGLVLKTNLIQNLMKQACNHIQSWDSSRKTVVNHHILKQKKEEQIKNAKSIPYAVFSVLPTTHFTVTCIPRNQILRLARFWDSLPTVVSSTPPDVSFLKSNIHTNTTPLAPFLSFQ